MNYQDTLTYLYNRLSVFHEIGAVAYKPGLENTMRLLDKLGNPHQKFKSIHVAGTNGKGSVSHTLSAILQASGLKTGLYTSPHLVDFGERIRVNGREISRDYVINFVHENRETIEIVQPSFFELTMAMAFQYFADSNIDIAVVEVGLGGRLDSTNIIQPLLSVITNISFDHTDFLGNSLELIAAEKAGIIKANVPVVIGEYLPETKQVFLNKADDMNAPLVFAQDEFSVEFKGYRGDKMIVRSDVFDNEIEFGLCGEYQVLNIATTLAAISELRKMGFALSDNNCKIGLRDVVELTGLKGRWQIVRRNPTVVLDTGHNKAGIEFVVNQLKHQDFRRLHVVIGVVSDKDVEGVVKLLPENAIYYFTQAQTKRALSADELHALALKYGLQGLAFPSVAHAVEKALQDAEDDDLIFIGGSNYVVGEALLKSSWV